MPTTTKVIVGLNKEKIQVVAAITEYVKDCYIAGL